MELYVPGEGVDPRLLAQQGKEVWTPALVGRMLISNLGRVQTRRRPAWTPAANRFTGYRQVYVPRHGKAYVHWLVIASFEGVQPGRVRRQNEDKGDNRLSNLFWG